MGFIRHVCRKNNIKLVSLNAAGLKYKARGGGFCDNARKPVQRIQPFCMMMQQEK